MTPPTWTAEKAEALKRLGEDAPAFVCEDALAEIERLNERIDDLLNCSSFACPYEKRMQAAESALAAVTRERETAQAQVQDWRGKVEALLLDVKEREASARCSDTCDCETRLAYLYVIERMTILGLTPEPPLEKA